MISSNPHLFWQLGRFVDFLSRSGTHYRIHSPFLFHLVEEVIRKKTISSELEKVEEVRKRSLRSREIIHKTDFGMGAGPSQMAVYPVPESKIARRSLMPRHRALRLYHLVKYLGANTILELGTSLGVTTAYLALANPGARVISIEGCPQLSDKAKNNLEMLGIDHAEIITGRFKDRLAGVLEELGTVDLLVIDGDHRKESVLANLSGCLPFLHNDSVVILDDIHFSPGMEEAWNIIRQWDSVTVSLDLYFTGWLFFRKESSREHFRLRYL